LLIDGTESMEKLIPLSILKKEAYAALKVVKKFLVYIDGQA
jgi:hypothetical protein